MRVWLPRVRGDRPVPVGLGHSSTPASPRPRGSTRPAQTRGDQRMGFPASAGIDPSRRPGWSGSPWLPRVRGDRPSLGVYLHPLGSASPRPRGSTPPVRRRRAQDRGFPASAGIDPLWRRPDLDPGRLPRVRGDRPELQTNADIPGLASPRPRGSTPRVGDGGALRIGFPASAGIDPWRWAGCWAPAWLPRVRGDRPFAVRSRAISSAASPRPRGSTPTLPLWRHAATGFPASAGIDPRVAARRQRVHGLPRVRGDRPSAPARRLLLGAASPRPRGSTRESESGCRLRDGFPASAGIDPSPETPGRSAIGLPRVRGDRPQSRPSSQMRSWASPRPRGSTFFLAAR